MNPSRLQVTAWVKAHSRKDNRGFWLAACIVIATIAGCAMRGVLS